MSMEPKLDNCERMDAPIHTIYLKKEKQSGIKRERRRKLVTSINNKSL